LACRTSAVTSEEIGNIDRNIKTYRVLWNAEKHICMSRLLRRIFRPKRDEVTGGWRKLLNEELHGVYCSPSIIRIIKSRRMRWAGHVARTGTNRNACSILVGNSERMRSLGRPRRRWEYNIKMHLSWKGWGGMDWIDLAQDRDRWRALVNTVTNLRLS
jgi:hypothetical protein